MENKHNEIKHTPGPWTVDKVYVGYVRNNNKQLIATAQGSAGDSRASDLSAAECQANAQLIAAAPEMLEVLKNISYSRGLMEWMDSHYEELRESLELAIKKAETGKSHD